MSMMGFRFRVWNLGVEKVGTSAVLSACVRVCVRVGSEDDEAWVRAFGVWADCWTHSDTMHTGETEQCVRDCSVSALYTEVCVEVRCVS